MISRLVLAANLHLNSPQPSQCFARLFSATSSHRDSFINHYDVLQLPQDCSQAELKRSLYPSLPFPFSPTLPVTDTPNLPTASSTLSPDKPTRTSTRPTRTPPPAFPKSPNPIPSSPTRAGANVTIETSYACINGRKRTPPPPADGLAGAAAAMPALDPQAGSARGEGHSEVHRQASMPTGVGIRPSTLATPPAPPARAAPPVPALTSLRHRTPTSTPDPSIAPRPTRTYDVRAVARPPWPPPRRKWKTTPASGCGS